MDKRELVVSRYFAICDSRCEGCEFNPLKKKATLRDCFFIAQFQSEEAGAEIGFEPWKEKIELSKKPIKKMTLEELKNYCEMVQAENKKCSVCAIKGDYDFCPFDGVKPNMWNLGGAPKFTVEERTVAKVIRDMYPEVVSVFREKETEELAMMDKYLNIRPINRDMFPTIKAGMGALIGEIIGDALSED